MVASFLPQLVRNNLYLRTRGEVLDNSASAMSVITQEIKHGSAIYTPTSVFDASPGQLSLETRNNLIATEDATFVDFYVDDGGLYVKREETDARLITSEKIKVESLIFTLLNSGSNHQAVRVSLTAYYDSPSAEIQQQSRVTLNSTVSFRSY